LTPTSGTGRSWRFTQTVPSGRGSQQLAAAGPVGLALAKLEKRIEALEKKVP
jgi:hypothetical protein